MRRGVIGATGERSSAARGGQRHRARRQLLVEHRTRSDFVPVVIFGVDPEDGDGRHLVIARHLFGELQRGERLEQREQRSAEEARLLAGDESRRSCDRRAAPPRRRARAGACRRSCCAAMTAAMSARRRRAPASARSRRPTRRDRPDRRRRTARRIESRTRSRRRGAGSREASHVDRNPCGRFRGRRARRVV